MGAYKQFLASDIIVTPFEVNKGFTFYWNADPTLSNSFIDRFLGKNITSSLFNPSSDPTTGTLSTQYQRLVYSSVKELYYSNYVSSSYGDTVNRPILIPGRDTEGNRLVGSTDNPSYDNYLQTTLSYPKIFPTASDALIGVISIPGRLFGDYIQPKSFKFTTESGSLTDDGEGNVWLSTPLTPQSVLVGNIYYPHGLITIIGNGNSYSGSAGTQYGTVFYGTGTYGGVGFGSMEDTILNFITTTSATCSFSSSYTIQETQYKCTIRENEYGFTLNPSVISSSADGTLYGFITESYFSPYISTIGLYDEQQNLLAIGKLAQPLPSSPTTDTTILINIDR
jgi:hypothetical protein